MPNSPKYDGKVNNFQTESNDTNLRYGDYLLINGNYYNVIQKWAEDKPKLGVFNIESSLDNVINYGLLGTIYKAILHITSKEELKQLETDLHNELVTLEWDGETFQVVPIQYKNQMILSGTDKYYIVEVAFYKTNFGV